MPFNCKMGTNNSIADAISSRIFALLKDNGGDPYQLPTEMRNFVMVFTAQGIIDNGGVSYLLDYDFPHLRSRTDVADAYDAINCNDEAQALRRVFAAALREQNDDIGLKEVDRLLCGSNKVWVCLDEYVVSHKEAFLN